MIDNTGNSNTLSNHQVLVEIDAGETGFWSHVASDGGDVRFLNSAEDTELDFFPLRFDYAGNTAQYWVKVDSVPASGTQTVYLYYGNASAGAAGSAENTFSYTTKQDRFYAASSVNGGNGALGISFFDNNDFEVGGLSDPDWDTAAGENPKTISSTNTGTGQNAQSTKPFAIEAGNVNSGEMWAPASWQSTLFVAASPRTGTNFAFYNPSSSSASVTVAKDGTTVDTFSLSAGSYVSKTSYVHTDDAHWRITSDQPIVAFQWGSSTYDQANIVPPATVWHGTQRNTRVICSEDNTTITIYWSDSTTNSNTCNANGVWSVGGGGTYGSGPAGKLVADKPVYAFSYADGNGTELQVWYRSQDLDVEYAIPNNYDYVACAAPYDNTTINIYDLSGSQVTSSGDLGSNGANYPHHYRDYTNRTGGFRVNADEPFYCYYEQAEQNDERNMANRVITRKGTYPEPQVSTIGPEEQSVLPVFTQNYYRWYANTDGTAPGSAWSGVSENQSIGASDNPPNTGDILRLRVSLQISNANLSASQNAFKLQYGQGSSCGSIETWNDVGAAGSGSIWRGYDNASPADGATLSSTLLSVSDVAQTYEEGNPTAANPNGVNTGQDGEWDFAIENNGAPADTTYCFRVVNDDGSVLVYNNYPQLTTNTAPGTASESSPFDNRKVSATEPSYTFYAADGSNDDLTYEIEWDTDPTFASPVTRSSDAHAGFQNLTTPADADPFNSGETVQFTVQPADALADGATYWWRVRAKDPNGSNTFGSWSQGRSVTVDTAVSAPAWYQTTNTQFERGTLSDTKAVGGGVEIDSVAGEYGTVTLSGNTASTVTLSKTYSDLVAVASPRHAPDSDTQRVARIVQKSATSFDIKVDNESGVLSGNTTVDWAAFEAGSWTIQDGGAGTQVIAGSQSVSAVGCNGSWPTGALVSFSPTFASAPVVVHTVSSNNDTTWTAALINDGTQSGEPTTGSMRILLNRSFASCSHGAETVDYAAFATGHGTNNGAGFDAAIGADTTSCCSASGYSTGYSQAFASAPQVTIVAQMGEDGGNGGYAVTHTGTAGTASTHYNSIDEDGPGADRSHTTEDVAVIAFGPASGSILRTDATSGVITSPAIDFNDATGPSWGTLAWNDNETNGSITYQIEYDTGSGWALIPDGDLANNSTGFGVSPVDLSGLNTATYDRIRVKANLNYSNDSPILQDWTVSWAEAVNNTPVASAVSVNSGDAAVTLTENATTSVTCAGTVTDADGYADIAAVGAYLFRTAAGTSTADNKNHKYSAYGDSECVPSNGSGNSEDYACTFAFEYYADPTDTGSPYASDDWTCELWPEDAVATGTPATDTIEVNSLIALGVTGTIDYGTIDPNTDTGSTNQTTTITNTGNRAIDPQISGADMSDGANTIPPSAQKYDASAFTYNTGGTSLLSTPTIFDLELPQGSAGTVPVTDTIYWGIGIPDGTLSGTYTGTNTFTAAQAL